MVRRLWVDDLRNPPNDEYVIVRTYDDAIARLSEEQFDEIYLDHDLADFKDGKERTGYDVALWLAERRYNGGHTPQHYFLLTANSAGRKRLIALIERYLT